MKYMLISNDPAMAAAASTAGVARSFVDLEIMGKRERQGHLDTLISGHSLDDVSRIREAVPETELLVRVNPLHEGTAAEIDAVLAAGANLLMLPMFQGAEELAAFAELVAGRAGIVPLVETPGALADAEAVACVPGLVELYLGLNDLHLALGRDFMFELLADGTVDRFAAVAHASGLPFGFGGIARAGEGAIPGELVLAEHLRLGSTSVILSRTFMRSADPEDSRSPTEQLAQELHRLREAEGVLAGRPEARVRADRDELRRRVEQVVHARRGLK